MYTLLWAMHLSLASLALLSTYLDRGKGLLRVVNADRPVDAVYADFLRAAV